MMFVVCFGKIFRFVRFLLVIFVGEFSVGSGTLDGIVILVGDLFFEECVCGLGGVIVSIVGVFIYVILVGIVEYVMVVGIVVLV